MQTRGPGEVQTLPYSLLEGHSVPHATESVGARTVPGKEGRPVGEGAGKGGPRGAEERGEAVVGAVRERGGGNFFEPTAWCSRPTCALHTQQAAGPKLERHVRVEAISRVVFDI